MFDIWNVQRHVICYKHELSIIQLFENSFFSKQPLNYKIRTENDIGW